MENLTATRINLQYLYTVSGGDTTFEKMVLLGAVDDIQTQIEKLQTDWDRKDAVNIHRIAHSLKSVVAISGLLELETNCRHLERLFADGRFHPEGSAYLNKIISLWIYSRPAIEQLITTRYR